MLGMFKLLKNKLANTCRVQLLHNLLNALFVLVVILIPFNEVWLKTLFIWIFLFWLLALPIKSLSIVVRQPPMIVAHVLLFMLVVSLLWSDNVEFGSSYIWRFVAYFFIPFLIVSSTLKEHYINVIIYAFIASVLASVLMVSGQFSGVLSGDVSRIVLSPNINPIPYCVVLAFTALLVIYFYI